MTDDRDAIGRPAFKWHAALACSAHARLEAREVGRILKQPSIYSILFGRDRAGEGNIMYDTDEKLDRILHLLHRIIERQEMDRNALDSAISNLTNTVGSTIADLANAIKAKNAADQDFTTEINALTQLGTNLTSADTADAAALAVKTASTGGASIGGSGGGTTAPTPGGSTTAPVSGGTSGTGASASGLPPTAPASPGTVGAGTLAGSSVSGMPSTAAPGASTSSTAAPAPAPGTSAPAGSPGTTTATTASGADVPGSVTGS